MLAATADAVIFPADATVSTQQAAYLRSAGSVSGLHRWVQPVRIDHGLGRYPVWVFGARVASSMQRVAFRPV